MANPKFKAKRSSVEGKVPATTQLERGEFAINSYDGKVFILEDKFSVGIATTTVTVNPWDEPNGVGAGLSYSGNVNVLGVVTATSFVGSLSGISTGADKVYVDESEDDDRDYNIIFTDGLPGVGNSHHTLQVDHTALRFNPGTNTLFVNRLDASFFSGPSVVEGNLTVDGDLRVNQKLRVRGDNQEFVVENDSGQNKFTVDTDNGNTHVYGDLEVDGSLIGNLNVTTTTGLDVNGNLNISGVTTTTGLDVNGNLNVSGVTTTSGLTVGNYSFPAIVGSEGQALKVNSSGDLEFGDVSSSSAGAGSTVYQTKEVFTAIEGQISFTPTEGYTDGFVEVYLNGIRLTSADYTADDETTVVLSSAANAGDEVEIVSYAGASGDYVLVSSEVADSGGVSTGKAIAMAMIFG